MMTSRILQWFLNDWLKLSYYLQFPTHHNSVLMPVNLQLTQSDFSQLHCLAAFLCAAAGSEKKNQTIPALKAQAFQKAGFTLHFFNE